MGRHVLYGALYHWFLLFRNQGFRGRTHRELSIAREAGLYTRRPLLMPFTALGRTCGTARIRRAGWPIHLVLPQFEHDASFRTHGPFAAQGDFLRTVIDGFARGAPRHHHLVIKAHPLENGRAPLRRIIRTLARDRGVAPRAHYVAGGKLARLLNHARAAVTVNSTAAQQVLWRGIPLRAIGHAVYGRPEFAGRQPLAAFFAQPGPPDGRAYGTTGGSS